MSNSAPIAIAPIAPHPKRGVTPLSEWYIRPGKKFTAILPPGKYYIGKLLPVMNQALYYELFSSTDYKSGQYMEKGTYRFFHVYITKGGGDGTKYPVQPQVFGVCPFSETFAKEPSYEVKEFKEYIYCKLTNNGDGDAVFTFAPSRGPFFCLAPDSD